MSVRVMAWVWEHSAAVGAERLVLLAIADCANDAGRDAYPAMSTIARKANVDKRTAQRSVRALAELGELEVLENAGPRGTNRYRLLMTEGRQDTTGGDTPRVANDRPDQSPPVAIHRGGTSSRKGRRPATRTILEPSTTPQPPADAGAAGPLDHCSKHSRYRRACPNCDKALTAVKAKPPWCGHCDETTRLVADLDSATAHRCQECHPLVAAPSRVSA